MNRLFKENLRIALHALFKNRLRTILSLLGMSIGIMSIVIVMSAGESLRLVLLQQLESFGTNTITIEVKVPNTAANSSDNAAGIAQGISITTMSVEDKEAITKLSGIATSYGAVLGQGIISSPYDEKRISYFAVTPEFDSIDTATMAKGHFYDESDEMSRSKYIVLGSDIAERLFPNQDPIGQSVKLAKTNFTVIGVFASRGAAGFINMDEMVFIPLATAQTYLLGFDHLSFIIAQMSDPSRSAAIAEDIRATMRENHDITDPAKDDFSVTTQEEAQDIIGTILSGVTLVLTIIAAVALVVGGVGIMNIMYVAVNERIFEIGLRKSFGARQSTIRSQFLIEAVLITLLGGFLGICFALGMLVLIYLGASVAGFSWPFAFSLESLILALLFSSTVGITFGYFPAKRAAELKPIEALSRSIA